MWDILNKLSWFMVIIRVLIFYIISKELIIIGIITGIIIKAILFNSREIYWLVKEIKKDIKNEIINEMKQSWINIEKTDNHSLAQEVVSPINIQTHENIETKAESPIIQEVPIKTETPKVEIVKEESWVSSFLSEFFAENLMAKIWGILLALWIIYLMSLVYNMVGPVLKILIWFILWFSVYGIWVRLNIKWFKKESMTLIWTWILINYIVILSGRFLMWENWFLSGWVTFFFLILNTIFSILVSSTYKSKNLLLFSIFFAYLIPFLLWEKSNTPYTLVWYSIILSVWTLIISDYKYKNQETTTSLILAYFSIILWNALVLAAPFDSNSYFIAKIVWFNLITFLNIYFIYKHNFKEHILRIFIISYLFLSAMLFNWIHWLWWMFSNIWILINYIIWIVWLLFSSTLFITLGLWTGILYILFLPIIILLFLLLSWHLFLGIFIIPLFLIIYLLVFSFKLTDKLNNISKYIFFLILWIFLCISNTYFSFKMQLNLPVFITLFATSFIFIIVSYYLSSKKDLTSLYSIWTLAGILILLPIIKITWEFALLSSAIILVFGLINYATPFINKNLRTESRDLIVWNIIGILFIWWNLFRFWKEYFPWVSIGIWFAILAIIYFIWWFILFQKMKQSKEIEADEWNKNTIYTFLWISISLFSTAVALVFSHQPIIISLIWLVQATIILFFTNKFSSNKIFIAGIVMFAIWILKLLSTSLWNLTTFEIVPTLIICISLFLNVFFIKNSTSKLTTIIKILHIIWLFIVYFILNHILKDHINSLILGWMFLLIISIIYNILKDQFLRKVFFTVLGFTFLIHIFSTNTFNIYWVNYAFTIITLFILSIEYSLFKDSHSKDLLALTWTYLFIISSIFLYHHTQDSFSLTIYRWILSLILVHIWIRKENEYIRWTWLYLLIITLIKIIFYDIWNGVDNWIVKIIAFIFVWWSMIYISVLYSQNKLNIKKDLGLDNSTPKIKEENQ